MPALATPDRVRFFSNVWTPVSSSNVLSARYDQKGQVLEIQFHTGMAYAYLGVPLQMAASFASAPSQGKWVWARLRRPNWPFSQFSV